MKELEFDVVIHLAGEQIVPNYMALKLTEANRHILLTTSRTKKQVDSLRRMFDGRGHDFLRHLEVLPTDYNDVCEKLESIVDLKGMRVGVNVTGGTKPMSVAALDFCRKNGFVPFYIDTQTRMISFFAETYKRIQMPKVFDTVDEFFRLSGFVIAHSGKTAEDIPESRAALVNAFWNAKDSVRRPIAAFNQSTDARYQSQKNCPPRCFLDARNELLRIPGKRGKTVSGAWEAVFPEQCSDWRKAARFGAGEWFEEWILLQFAKSRLSEEFRDLRSGVSLAFLDDQNKRNVQEIDVAFTDGYTLTLVECKAGKVFQEHIQKLENITRQIGGAMGRGILCAINYQYEDDVVAQRVKNGNISLVAGDEALRMLPSRYRLIRPRQCYQSASDYT